MILGIDAASIRHGGTVTHLVELLGAADPAAHGFSRVVVWAGSETLARLPSRPWLVSRKEPALDRGLAARVWWQWRELPRRFRAEGCDLLFVPGGYHLAGVRPRVVQHQNLLPFEPDEHKRYGWSRARLRLLLLGAAYGWSFRTADGVIFHSERAREVVLRKSGPLGGAVAVIPHGVHCRFHAPPRPVRSLEACTPEAPFRLLYVSRVDAYKHQWHVVEAVATLRREGLPVALDLVGSGYPPALRRLEASLRRHDPEGRWARYHGELPHVGLEGVYASADAFVYASSCETFGLILTEAMAAGVPIASSDRSSMPEVLGDAGVYFDPERPDTIAEAVRRLAGDPALRERLARSARERAGAYSWDRCAGETFGFLQKMGGRAP